MKCLKCDNETQDDSVLCVNCKKENEMELELPALKQEEVPFDAIKYVDNNLEDTKEFFINREIDLGKTRAINPLVNTKEYDLFTLEDEINKQIDAMNESNKDDNVAIYVEGGFDGDLSKTTIMNRFDNVSNLDVTMGMEKIKKEESLKDSNSNNALKVENNKEVSIPKKSRSLMDEDLTTNESVSKRKNSLVVAFGCTILAIIIAFLGISYFYNNDSQLFGNTEGKEDYLFNIDNVLNDYYETLDEASLTGILEKIKDDDDEVVKLQDIIVKKMDVWVDNFKNSDLTTKDSFEKMYSANKKLLNNLYNVSITNSDDIDVKLINLSNYKNYIDKIQKIYDDGTPYYEALDYYNEKSYNEAYQMLSYVEEGNVFYDKSRFCMDKIVKDIISLLNNDITKIKEGIDSLSESEKIDKYITIEEIIVTYNLLYDKVKLSDNDVYKSLLEEYRKLINGEYNQE